MKACRIAIIGGGVSGSLTAVQLLRQATTPLELILLERRSTLGLGVAYSTTSMQHVLNVPAQKMSALPDDPQHLVRWLTTNIPDTYQPHDFIPRPLYGRYIQELLASSLTAANARLATTASGLAHQLSHIAQTVVALNPLAATTTTGQQCEIQLADGQQLIVDRVVLALGNFLPTPPALSQTTSAVAQQNEAATEFYASPFYANNPWDAAVLATIPRQAPVLLLGTGLTTIDLILSLVEQGHTGTIHVVSRRGLLPHPHRLNLTPYQTALTRANLPLTVRGLLHRVRQDVHQATSQGTDWRAVIDSLRPFSHDIWQRWSTTEQRRFLRHVRPYWDVHRHRIAPNLGERLQQLLASGQVIRHTGRVVNYQWSTTTTPPVKVTLQPRDQAPCQILAVAKVINGTGPEADYRRLDDPLVQHLRQSGHIAVMNIGTGLAVATNGAILDAQGQPSAVLFTLGPPQKGVIWETTAVPEIREQAASLATVLLQSFPRATN
jgi:uncharacterized NAD(P)/FAD-binding protein YdhS